MRNTSTSHSLSRNKVLINDGNLFDLLCLTLTPFSQEGNFDSITILDNWSVKYIRQNEKKSIIGLVNELIIKNPYGYQIIIPLHSLLRGGSATIVCKFVCF